MRKELIKKRDTTRTIGECYEKFRLEKKALLLKDDYLLSELKHYCTRTECSLDDDVSIITKQSVYNYTEIMNNYAVKIASINHYLSSIRTIFYYFMNNGWIENFKINLVKGQQETLKTYNEQELITLCNKPSTCATYTEWRSWTIVNILIATGCRASTLISIELNDIDYKNKEITYRHLKNKQIAVIPLSTAAIKVLNDFNGQYDLSDGKYQFPEVNLNKMTVGALEKSIRAYCIKRNVVYKGIHTFRHTFASLFIRNNGNPMILQKYLTHSTLDMTKKYIHIFNTDWHNQVELYNPLDNLKSNISRTNQINKR